MSRTDYISKSEAARRMGVNRWTIYWMIRDGRVPSDELGRIPRAAFDAWFQNIQYTEQSLTQVEDPASERSEKGPPNGNRT